MEPGGHGIETGEHGAPLKHGRVGIYFWYESADDANRRRQIEESYSISAGLDFRPSARNMRISTALDALITCLLPTMKPSEAFKTLCLHEGSSRRWNPPMPAHALKMMRENPEKSSYWWLTFPVAAIKTSSPFTIF